MLDKEDLKNLFENQEFFDYDTVVKSRNIMLAETLKAVRESGTNEIDVLTRVITKIKIDEDGKKDKKYSVEISLHKPGSIDELRMFDACLTTYYFNELEGKEPVIRYISGDSAQGKYLKTVSEEDMLKHCDKLIEKNEKLLAQQIKNTWEIARELDRFEENI